MTSVDSGVETGNDSNDSAKTDTQFNNPGLIETATSTSMDMQLLPVGTRELDGAKINTRFSSTPTIISRPENTLSFTLPNIHNNEATQSFEFFNLESGSTQPIQFKTPPQFMIHPKSIKRTLSINCPSNLNQFGDLKEIHEKEMKPIYMHMHSYSKSRKQELRSVPFCKIGGNLRRGFKMRVAATTNNVEMMQRLLEQGVSPNSYDEQGRSPLHLASCRGYVEMVKLLLDYGADPNHIDCIGNTPLHLAAVTSKGQVVKLLLNAGTDISLNERHKYNPLHLAQTKLKLLQSCGASDTSRLKVEVCNIVNMLLAYLERQKVACEEIEALTSFCSRISLSNTTNQVQDDVKELLTSIDSLTLTN
ncbi:hypothetical protein PV326_008419 [Microctonus aethiopoides]|nr:hypothetical protein PV326_008419 [Microctonus aethiopoides]